MSNTCAADLTIVEMLDALEAEVTAMRTRGGPVLPREHALITPAILRAEMQRAALTEIEFAKVVGVTREELDIWLSSQAPIPVWVPAAVQLFALLTPSARRKLLSKGSGDANKHAANRTHPFSRIEDL